MKNKIDIKKAGAFLLLHAILLMYALSDVTSKLAASKEFMSFQFILLYGIVLFILFLYALLWQQILKIIPLITAYVNKAVTIIWGLVFGVLIFHEQITVGKIIGAILIISGVILVALEDEKS